MTLYSTLNRFFDKFPYMRLIVCYLPCLLVLPFSLFYMIDLARVVTTLSYNNVHAEDSRQAGTLKEVTDFNKTDSGYDIIVSGSDSFEVDVYYGDKIYTLYSAGDSWYKLAVSDYDFMYVDVIDLPLGEGVLDVPFGEVIAEVYLTKDGYEVRSGDNVSIVDDISSVQRLVSKDSGVRFKVTGGYMLHKSAMPVSFCSTLQTDGLYYDVASEMALQNIDDTFWVAFLVSTRMIVVTICIVFYLIFLILARNTELLRPLKTDRVFIVNIMVTTLLPICIILTYLLL